MMYNPQNQKKGRFNLKIILNKYKLHLKFMLILSLILKMLKYMKVLTEKSIKNTFLAVLLTKIFVINVCRMINCNILQFFSVVYFHDLIMCQVQPGIFWDRKIRLWDKNKSNIQFSASNKQLFNCDLKLFVTQVYDHVIKNNQDFSFSVWVVPINIWCMFF